ncbi:MAG: BatA domain-containing protein [Candidatus Binataceae bacterium]|jgi:hypothetical protein
MGLLYPSALVFFALVPALLIAYLVRERPTRVTVSSVLAFRALRGLKGERPWGRPRLDWLFIVEAVILSLAVLAMAQPYVVRGRKPIAVVLDNSAAMQALTASGQTRYDVARARLAAMLSSAPADASITVYLTAPQPHQVGDAPFEGAAAARSAIGAAAVTDAPDQRDALGRLLSDLASGRRFSEVIFASCHPLSGATPHNVRAIIIDEPIANYAIGSFGLRREGFGAATMRARLKLANFSPNTQTLKVVLTGDGKPLAHAESVVEARGVVSLEFPQLAPASVYRAELQPSDSFPLDNVAFATAGAIKPIDVLFVSPVRADADSLGALPGVKVTVQSPENFSPANAVQADLTIFEYAVPKELPAGNALLVMPPGGDLVFNFSVRPAESIQIASWQRPDPLTDEVNFRLLELRRGEFFDLHPWMESIVSGNGGGLILAGTRQGHRYVATGFNPFPYLGKQNLPMSVLTLNMLSYLAGLGADSVGYRTGEPWLVPAGVAKIILPSGSSVAVKPGTLFTAGTQQGIYELVDESGERRPRAAMLGDLAESDLDLSRPVTIEAPAEAVGPPSFTANIPLAGYLIAAMLALAAAEAMIAYRRRRRALEVHA